MTRRLAPGKRMQQLPGAICPTFPSCRAQQAPNPVPANLSLFPVGQRRARIEQLGRKPWGMRQRDLGWGGEVEILLEGKSK